MSISESVSESVSDKGTYRAVWGTAKNDTPCSTMVLTVNGMDWHWDGGMSGLDEASLYLIQQYGAKIAPPET